MIAERKPWAFAAAVAVVTALVACSPAEEPRGPAAPPPTAAATTEASPTPSEDPYAIPDEIDEAYVEKVLEALSENYAAAAREVAEAEEVTPEARDYIEAIYTPDGAKAPIRQYADVARGGSIAFTRDATAAEITVERLESANEDCIFVLVVQDPSSLFTTEVEPFEAYYHLVAETPQDSLRDLNPTPWVIAADAEPPTGGKRYEDPCSGE